MDASLSGLIMETNEKFRQTNSELRTIIIIASIIRSLRIDSIEVPSAVANGTQIMLVCNYDLQNDQVSLVKHESVIHKTQQIYDYM